MGKKHSNTPSPYRGYLSDLKRELSSVKLPAIVLSITLTAALTLPYIGEKLASLFSLYSISSPEHICTFVNFDSASARQKVESLVAQNSKTFSLLSGTEQLGTTLLEEVSDIASIECSLDRNHKLRLVITGHNGQPPCVDMDKQKKDSEVMQVPQHHSSGTPTQTERYVQTTLAPQVAPQIGETLELQLNTTHALFSKAPQAPKTFHTAAKQRTTKKLRSITVATNEIAHLPSTFFDNEPNLSSKRNQL